MSEPLQVINALEARVAQLEGSRPTRPARPSSVRVRWRRVLVGCLVAAAMPAAVLGGHLFADVPTDHTFHADVAQIAEAGVTTGCAATRYCPDEPVTRGQMAAFLRRGGGHLAASSGTAVNLDLDVAAGATITDFIAVRDLTMTVPGASNSFGPTQRVLVQGHVEFQSNMDAANDGCPCVFQARIRDLATGALSGNSTSSFFMGGSAFGFLFHSLDVVGVFDASPGGRTYRLELRLLYREDDTDADSYSFGNGWQRLVATTYPYGK